ncbi:MAG TPA: helix-turn-helix transcriptional regulator [Capsulimonadaceae bacterium]|jgi:AraC-like DNA-binding protein
MSETIINYPRHEQLLPMTFAGASPLVARGIARAAISQYDADSRIDQQSSGRHTVIYTIAGSATVALSDGEICLEAESFWVAPAGTSFSIESGANGWDVMWFSISPIALWRHLESGKPHFRFQGQAARIVQVLSGLIFESSSPSLDSVQMGRNFAEVVGIYLDRRLHRAGEVASDDMRQRLGMLWAAVSADLQRPWTVADMAQVISLSESHLYRIVRQYHADTPLGVMTTLRIQRAQDLLAHTPHKLEFIATRLGYASPFALSKAFKRVTGHSPQQYRREQEQILAPKR